MSINIDRCEQRFREGLAAMDIVLDDVKISTLLGYLEALHKWNQAYNLSAIRDPEQMVSRHLLDSLALAPYLKKFVSLYSGSFEIIDVGTGAGLPGFPLAVVFPEINVSLLDSNGKKTRFLFQTAVKLGLRNINVENNRVEKYSPAQKFAIVTSRAFASLEDMIEGCQHLLDKKGEYWAMKGQYPEQELADCSDLVEIKAVHRLTIPDCNGERHLLVLKNKSSS